MSSPDYAAWFRGSTPYISAHRDKTFVVLLPGEAIEHQNLRNIIHDLALLHVLGVRLVLVHGARPQIQHTIADSQFHNHRRITRNEDMAAISGVHGQIKATLEALFSTGLPNSPLHNVDIPVISGNFVVAQPMGILDGVDHLCTGKVRRIETSRIATTLKNGGVVLQSPLGYSPSGQAYNLTSESLATDIALAIKADKLIVLDQQSPLRNPEDERISTLTPSDVEQWLGDASDESLTTRLTAMVRAVQGGVNKAQLVSFEEDGALLAELFTPEGHGTQILTQPRQSIRPAESTDVQDIVEIIRPLEQSGVLVRRDRDRLEQEVNQFLVAEVDGIVVGCCAVYTYDTTAEIACVAVHENFQGIQDAKLGQRLLQAAETTAKDNGAASVFVLTTQTHDWFIEQGFTESTPDSLPTGKQDLYNWQRNAKVMLKSIT
ncbi:MAG: amino-acid N-acetyltransferase [Pseudomonadota bacterium]